MKDGELVGTGGPELVAGTAEGEVVGRVELAGSNEVGRALNEVIRLRSELAVAEARLRELEQQ